MKKNFVPTLIMVVVILVLSGYTVANHYDWFGFGKQMTGTTGSVSKPVVFRPNIIIQPLSFCECAVTECDVAVPWDGIDLPPDDMPPHHFVPNPVPVTPPIPDEPTPDDETPIPVPPDDETAQPPYRWRWNCQNDDAPENIPPMPGNGK